MADVQDDDQWLYGDEQLLYEDKDEEGELNNDKEDESDKDKEREDGGDKEKDGDKETPMEEGENKDATEGQEENDKDGEDEDNEKGDEDESSDDDDLTITIGALKTQPDIIQAPTTPHGARFQPKPPPTTGLKDDDFSSSGKINGIPVTEFNLAELEDKPWRKPGADISDYFNYGFNEETWFKYCERQKRMRIHESGAGLTGLGISVTKPFGNPPPSIPVAIINDNSKYGGGGQRPKAGPPPRNKGMGQIDVIGGSANKASTIQVMTADRREYSNKVMMNGPPPTMMPPQLGYNDMEFGGNPYGDAYYPPSGGDFYGNPPFSNPPPWVGGGEPPVPNQNNWEGSGGPPVMPPVTSGPNYYDSESVSAPPPPPPPVEQEDDRHRSRRSHRSRSRSPSRHKDRERDRHSSRHQRSRSRSPSHRHKRKKSKRERDAD